MNYLSVCSGVEAATVAWHHMGWQPVAFSEIEKFPSQVLQHHYPSVPNMGDMTKFKEWNFDRAVNLLVGGTPCQSFSVAGLRKGLDDPRGNLALTYVAILDKFRPKWCVWENVPGVLSSGCGRDFGSFLGALVELGYGFAYRVLDAQNFGVAQRRRRVFVVGCLGDWESAAKVLFESESLRGDTKKSRGEGKEIARCLTRGVSQRLDGETDTFITQVYENHGTDSRVKPVNVSPTVTRRWGTGGNNVPLAQSFSIQGSMIGRSDKAGPQGDGINKEISFTLNTTDSHGVVHGTQDPCHSDIAFALGRNNGQENVLLNNMSVRRLTPVECERLQGFPDNYTDIKLNGKPTPDSSRYKAMGNSMAVPVMRWIGERIQMVESNG